MRCPNCQSEKLVVIKLRPSAKDEVSVMFRSCRACEHKWWEREDNRERLPLTTVLEMATVRKGA